MESFCSGRSGKLIAMKKELKNISKRGKSLSINYNEISEPLIRALPPTHHCASFMTRLCELYEHQQHGASTGKRYCSFSFWFIIHCKLQSFFIRVSDIISFSARTCIEKSILFADRNACRTLFPHFSTLLSTIIILLSPPPLSLHLHIN